MSSVHRIEVEAQSLPVSMVNLFMTPFFNPWKHLVLSESGLIIFHRTEN